jgi:DNA-binding NtrC family response regulator
MPGREIIVADIDGPSRRRLVDRLTGAGFVVHPVGTATELVDTLAEMLSSDAALTKPKTVVIGAAMPGLELIDTIEIWRSVYRVLNVICICEPADRVSLDRARRMRALATFERPVDVDAIADACGKASLAQ